MSDLELTFSVYTWTRSGFFVYRRTISSPCALELILKGLFVPVVFGTGAKLCVTHRISILNSSPSICLLEEASVVSAAFLPDGGSPSPLPELR